MIIRPVSTSRTPARHRRRAACAAAFLLASAGCGRPPECIVSGTVHVDSKPAAGVYIVLHPAGQPVAQDMGTARTDQEGRFSLAAAGPGDAAVTAFWPKVKVVEGETIEGADLLAGRYRDPRHPITRFTIHEGDNILPTIELAGARAARAEVASPPLKWQRPADGGHRTRFVQAIL